MVYICECHPWICGDCACLFLLSRKIQEMTKYKKLIFLIDLKQQKSVVSFCSFYERGQQKSAPKPFKIPMPQWKFVDLGHASLGFYATA